MLPSLKGWSVFDTGGIVLNDAVLRQAALSRELALIQGPPGTGKTFVGIQLVKALLANTHGNIKTSDLGAHGIDIDDDDDDRAMGRVAHESLAGPCVGPVLIVCFTNHALDQFLEGLLEAGLEGLVRVGGR